VVVFGLGGFNSLISLWKGGTHPEGWVLSGSASGIQINTWYEKKDRSFPVIIKYEDDVGNQKETSSMVYVKAFEPPTPTPAPTPVLTKAPDNPAPVTTQRFKAEAPGFTAPMVLIGFLIVVLLIRRR